MSNYVVRVIRVDPKLSAERIRYQVVRAGYRWNKKQEPETFTGAEWEKRHAFFMVFLGENIELFVTTWSGSKNCSVPKTQLAFFSINSMNILILSIRRSNKLNYEPVSLLQHETKAQDLQRFYGDTWLMSLVRKVRSWNSGKVGKDLLKWTDQDINQEVKKIQPRLMCTQTNVTSIQQRN